MPKYIDQPHSPQIPLFERDYSGNYGLSRPITRYSITSPIPWAVGHCKAAGVVVRSHDTTDQDNQWTNPSIETDTSGFTATGDCTIARSSEQASGGTYSLKVTLAAGSIVDDAQGGWEIDVTSLTTAGESYDFTFKLMGPAHISGQQYQAMIRLWMWDDVDGYQYWDVSAGSYYRAMYPWASAFTKLSCRGKSFNSASTTRKAGIECINQYGTGGAAEVSFYCDEVVVTPYIPTDKYRILIAYSLGEVSGANDQTLVDDTDWDDLEGTNEMHFYTGTVDQTVDSDDKIFVQNRQYFRGVAYASILVDSANDTGASPSVYRVCDWSLLEPIGGGTKTFSRNPARVLWQFMRTFRGIAAADIDTTSFTALETYCNEVPTGQTDPRYRFDYVFDRSMSLSDMEKLICSSFFGRVIKSQGKWKVVYDHESSSVYTFDEPDEDNIVELTPEHGEYQAPNVIRVKYRNADEDYETDTLEWKVEESIKIIGEISVEESCDYLVDEELARRRVAFIRDKKRYCRKWVKLSARDIDADKLEIYDRVQVTHSYLGWTLQDMQVIEKKSDEWGRCTFLLEEYNASVYHDGLAPAPTKATSTTSRLYAPPVVENLEVTEGLRTLGDGTQIPTIEISFSRPNYPYAHQYVIWIKKGESGTWIEVYTGSSTSLVYDALEVDTYYVKVQAVNYQGRATPFDECATAAVIVDGKDDAPSDVTWDDANCTFISDITLIWNPIADADLAFYEIRLANSDWGTNDSNLVVQKLGTTHVIPAPGSTSMTFYIKARDRSGNYSANADVITLNNDAPTMGTVTADFSTNDCILTWDPVSQLILAYYTVQVYDGDPAGAGNLIYTAEHINYNHFVFDYATNSGLSGGPFRDLWFRVTATSKFGLTDSSDAHGQNTAPSTITTLSLIPGLNGMTLICGPLLGDVIGYEFGCDTDNPPTDTIAVGTNFATFTDLTGGTTYYCRVRARDAFGYGSWSSVQSAAALEITVDETDLDIPLTSGVTWSCASGVLSWTAHKVLFQNTWHDIAAGNTSSAFVYWDSSSPTTYTGASSVPTGLGIWVMCYQSSDVAYPAQQGKILHGGLIQANTVTLSKLIGTGSLSIVSGGTLSLAGGSITMSSGTFGISGGTVSITGGTLTMSAGTLTISSIGKLSISSSTGIELTSTGGINCLAGSDITMVGNASNPSKLILSGTSYNVELHLDATGANAYLVPTNYSGVTLNLGQTYVSGDTFGYNNIYGYCTNILRLRSEYISATGRYAELYAVSNAGSPYARMRGYYSSSYYAEITCQGASGAQTITMRGNIADGGGGFNGCRIALGTYTGDGNTTAYAAVTTLVFTPKYVRIWRRGVVGSMEVWERSSQDSTSTSTVNSTSHQKLNTRGIKSLDSAGFTVWGSADPNISGTVYEYLAIG